MKQKRDVAFIDNMIIRLGYRVLTFATKCTRLFLIEILLYSNEYENSVNIFY